MFGGLYMPNNILSWQWLKWPSLSYCVDCQIDLTGAMPTCSTRDTIYCPAQQTKRLRVILHPELESNPNHLSEKLMISHVWCRLSFKSRLSDLWHSDIDLSRCSEATVMILLFFKSKIWRNIILWQIKASFNKIK